MKKINFILIVAITGILSLWFPKIGHANNTYIDEKHGYKVSIPSDWNIDGDGQFTKWSDHLACELHKMRTAEGVIFIATREDKGLTLRQLAEEEKKQMDKHSEEAWRKYNTSSKDKWQYNIIELPYIIGEEKALRLDIEPYGWNYSSKEYIHPESTTYHADIVFIRQKNTIFTINFINSGMDKTKFDSVCEQILKSFSFVDDN
ncbi:MAG: hypothetical protein GY858_01060 [Candidatus Omnitrophica bacterium]|nr:hypothetical protein [Candidatus Omnitrophota bacterium]